MPFDVNSYRQEKKIMDALIHEFYLILSNEITQSHNYLIDLLEEYSPRLIVDAPHEEVKTMIQAQGIENYILEVYRMTFDEWKKSLPKP